MNGLGSFVELDGHVGDVNLEKKLVKFAVDEGSLVGGHGPVFLCTHLWFFRRRTDGFVVQRGFRRRRARAGGADTALDVGRRRQRQPGFLDVAQVENDLAALQKRVPADATLEEPLFEVLKAVVAALEDQRLPFFVVQFQSGPRQQRENVLEQRGRAVDEGRGLRRRPDQFLGQEDMLDVGVRGAVGELEVVGRVSVLPEQAAGHAEGLPADAGVVKVRVLELRAQPRQVVVHGVRVQHGELDLVADVDEVALQVVVDELEDLRRAVDDQRVVVVRVDVRGRHRVLAFAEVLGEVAGGVGAQRRPAEAERLVPDLHEVHLLVGQDLRDGRVEDVVARVLEKRHAGWNS